MMKMLSSPLLPSAPRLLSEKGLLFLKLRLPAGRRLRFEKAERRVLERLLRLVSTTNV